MFAHKGNPHRSAQRGRRKGRFALLAGAAGLAYKHRQRLTSLLGRARGQGRGSTAAS